MHVSISIYHFAGFNLMIIAESLKSCITENGRNVRQTKDYMMDFAQICLFKFFFGDVDRENRSSNFEISVDY